MPWRFIPCELPVLASLIVGLLPTSNVEVRLKSDRVRMGVPDASTDEKSLRLRSGQPDAFIVFGIPWDEIAEIREHNESWTPDRFGEFRKRLTETIADPQQADLASDDDPETPVSAPSTRPLWQAPTNGGRVESSSPRVRHIEIEAVAANWDSDLAWDGIVLRVWPLDKFGRVVNVPGSLVVTLTAHRGFPPGSDPSAEQIEPIGYWYRYVRPPDYGRDGVSLQLEYQYVHPERRNAADTDRWHVYGAHPDWFVFANSGDVHVRMSVPGHGTFTASTSLPVRLRRFSPLRDDYFLRHGTRWFPHE